MTVDQTTTIEKPQRAKTKPKEEKPETKKPEEPTLEEEIEVLEPVEKVVERKLTYNGEEKTFLQHEMSFFSKLKFFRLLSGTLRLAAQDDTGEGGVADLLQEAFVGAQQFGNQQDMANVFLDSLLRLIELAPDFMEETYVLALNVKPEDSAWVMLSLQNIDDETGLDILDVFVAQNGKAISDFFNKRLGKLTKRLSQFVPKQNEEESETTA